MSDVGSDCRAGTGCGKCRSTIHDMLESSGRSCGGCLDCPLLAGEAA